jgi:hypothetical protein
MEKYGAVIKYGKRMVMAVLLLIFCSCNQHNKKSNPMPITKSVKGTVYNLQGKPLTDAVVMITAGSHSFQDIACLSNEKGEFYLDNLILPGNYTIQINWQGASVNKTINLKETDSIFTVHF